MNNLATRLPQKGTVPSGSKKKGSFFRLLGFILKNNPILLPIAVVAIIGSSMTSIEATSLTKRLIDNYIDPLRGVVNPDYSGLNQFILYMASLYIIALICVSIYSNLMMYITQGTLKKLRSKLFTHLEGLPISYFDKNSHGNIMSRFTNDVDSLRQMISQSLPSILSVFVTIVFVLFKMIQLNIALTCLAFGILMTIILAIFIINKISRKYFIGQQSSMGKLNGYINEMISGQRVIKVFCHEEKTVEDFEKLNNELFENARKANLISNLAMPILMNIGIISYAVVVIVGSIVAINFPLQLSLGALATFMILLRSLTNPVSQVSQQINFIIMANAGAGRIFELLDLPKEFDEGKVHLVNIDEFGNVSSVRTNKWAWQNEDGQLVPLRGDVRLKNVNFGYVPEKLVLHDVSLFAKPGQKIAFVGATGAGKTTITNLINRFYDIQSGSIIIDGIDIKNINKPDLRRALGMVLQDTNLFTGTIKENIKFAKPDATDDEVVAAGVLSNADSFIRLLPDGYDTVISGDGGTLSQGQRQLLSIARTAISNPPVLILDEATSSIDTRTEKLVQEGMDRLMKDRTVFVIAHRLSTIKNSRAIMVLDFGRIIERGSHDELIALKGQYYKLYMGAFELD